MIKQTISHPKKLTTVNSGQSFARDGEGHSVALTVVNVIKNKADGTETFQYGLDITQAKVPQRRYAAELANVTVRDNELRFSFAIRTVSGDGFESVLIIRLSPGAADSMYESFRTMASPSLPEILVAMRVQPEPLQPIDKSPENTGNVANMMANFVAIGISGYDTTLDFYHASAFAMRAMPETKSLDMDPKVRVDMRSSLFAGLMEQIPTLLKELTPLPSRGSK